MRNFGIHRSSLPAPCAPLELGKVSKPSLDEFELRAGLLFFLVALLPVLFVLAVVVGYALFVA